MKTARSVWDLRRKGHVASLLFALGGGADSLLGLQDVVIASAGDKVADVFNCRPGDHRQGLLGEKGLMTGNNIIPSSE